MYDNAVTTGAINEDIEGQERPNSSNPGADNFSLESIRYAPLTPDDVGPNAYEDINTSTANEYEISEVLAYPVPANNILHLNNIDSKVNKIEIVNLEGTIVLSFKIQAAASRFTINTSKLVNGIYMLQFSKKGDYSKSKKIIIQH